MLNPYRGILYIFSTRVPRYILFTYAVRVRRRAADGEQYTHYILLCIYIIYIRTWPGVHYTDMLLTPWDYPLFSLSYAPATRNPTINVPRRTRELCSATAS